jgi:hypothetical protein
LSNLFDFNAEAREFAVKKPSPSIDFSCVNLVGRLATVTYCASTEAISEKDRVELTGFPKKSKANGVYTVTKVTKNPTSASFQFKCKSRRQPFTCQKADNLSFKITRTTKGTVAISPDRHDNHCPHPYETAEEHKKRPFHEDENGQPVPSPHRKNTLPTETRFDKKRKLVTPIRDNKMYSTCDCDNRQQPHQVEIANHGYSRKHFWRADNVAREGLGELFKYIMFRREFLRVQNGIASKRELSRIDIQKKLARLGVTWQTIRDWFIHADEFPKKFLIMCSGEKGLNSLSKQAITAGLNNAFQDVEFFFTDGNHGDTTSLATSSSGCASPRAQEILLRAYAYFAKKFDDFKKARPNNKTPEATWQDFIDADDPLAGGPLRMEMTLKIPFVLIYSVIQGANLMRLFGNSDVEFRDALARLDTAQALLNDAARRGGDDGDDGDGGASAATGSGGANRRLLDAFNARIRTCPPLTGKELSNLQLRIYVVHTQVIRQMSGWTSPDLAQLLQLIEHKACEQKCVVSERFARFQSIMCRLSNARQALRAQYKGPLSSNVHREIIKVAIDSLKKLEAEYDTALGQATDTCDAKTESFLIKHRHFVRAEFLNWSFKKLESGEPVLSEESGGITAEQALPKWERMYEDAARTFGTGHRHTVYAIRQVVRLRLKLDRDLGKARDLLDSAIEEQQGETWKEKNLMPLRGKLAERGFPSRFLPAPRVSSSETSDSSSILASVSSSTTASASASNPAAIKSSDSRKRKKNEAINRRSKQQKKAHIEL